ncbi:SdpI family protein [Flavobacterium adhaerens]|uniref:SdpI family protein n=1 Tax=Flavobacterium adhaerens TaxID=3149043 RepID=UPI0032B4212E
MNFELKKELPLVGIILLPFIYLAFIWNTLPEKVPTHWSIKGDIDHWGDKTFLIGVPFMFPVFVYVLFLIIPKIDPKKRIALMGRKFDQIKFIVVLFASVLALFVIYCSKSLSFSSPNFVFVLIGILFIAMGNYFKVIQPNYFLGIRTPWTLENNEVWKLTHVFAGKLWLIGGSLIVLGALLFEAEFLGTVFIVFVTILAFIPMVYSYIVFKEIEKRDKISN